MAELVDVTFTEAGEVPAAVAVLTSVPASTLAWVSVYDFVQVIETPGSRVVAGQVTVPTVGSLTPTDVSGRLPLFSTTNVYVTVEPAVLPVGVPAVFARAIFGLAGIVTVFVSLAVNAAPVGGFAVTPAVFTTEPLVTSACVSVYVAVQVVLAPTAKVVTGQEIPVTLGSVTTMPDNDVWPLLVTTNEYGIWSPASGPFPSRSMIAPACLSNVRPGLALV